MIRSLERVKYSAYERNNNFTVAVVVLVVLAVYWSLLSFVNILVIFRKLSNRLVHSFA